MTRLIENLFQELEITNCNSIEYDYIIDTLIEKIEEQLKGVY
jgi:hypothetical protein